MIVKKKIVALILCIVTAIISSFTLVGCSGGDKTNGAYYSVNYNLNYETGSNDIARTRVVKSGTRAQNWRAYREGYNLDGWYTDPACSSAFDFDKGVTGDVTLYAKWNIKPGNAEVVFDYGYAGKANKTLSVEKTTKIKEKHYPTSKDTERMGMIFTGWYKDAAKTQKWDSATSTVEDDTTLYAGYEYDPSWVERNADGSVKFDNVTADVWLEGQAYINYDIFKKIADDFNKEYAGKIQINAKDGWIKQEVTCLRIGMTQAQMENAENNNYNVADVFTAAGLDFNYDDYYANALNDGKLKGVQKVLPFAARFPYIVYNKELMGKYWSVIGNKLPTNYTELTTLMKAAYEGEKAANANFLSFGAYIGNNPNHFYENYLTTGAMIGFAQNDVKYYYHTGKVFANDWNVPAEKDKVATAMKNTYGLLGNKKINGGRRGGSVQNVADGKVLMQLIPRSEGNAQARFWENSQWVIKPTAYTDQAVVDNLDKLGILPVEGLFTDNSGDERNATPIYSWGLQFCNLAKNVTNVELCAQAVFAKYFVEHAYEFASEGVVPINKAAYTEYQKSTNEIAMVTKEAVNPENFYTLLGMRYEKQISSEIVGWQLVLPYLQGDDPDDVDASIDKIRDLISAKLS